MYVFHILYKMENREPA